ncbi:hypothetical protein HAX54_049915, partial [Datura stramonium]|nr:hypothetical protein [Datura stramonium]
QESPKKIFRRGNKGAADTPLGRRTGEVTAAAVAQRSNRELLPPSSSSGPSSRRENRSVQIETRRQPGKRRSAVAPSSSRGSYRIHGDRDSAWKGERAAARSTGEGKALTATVADREQRCNPDRGVARTGRCGKEKHEAH